jgi:hypothetical protein
MGYPAKLATQVTHKENYSQHDKNMQCLIWIKEQSLAHLLIIADKFPLKYLLI